MLILYFVGVVLLFAVDQLSKLAVISLIKPTATVPIWNKVFHLTYLENRGAAFGILQNKFGLFFIITILVVVFITAFLIRKRPKSLHLNVALTLLVGGALGNFADRMLRGFVVDFLDFRLIHFPVFNLADCFVVVGAILLAWYIVFIDGKQKQPQENKENE